MSGRSSSRDAGVRDWVNSTLYGEDLRPQRTSRIHGPKQSFHDSSLELQEGLEMIELDTMPAELMDHFEK